MKARWIEIQQSGPWPGPLSGPVTQWVAVDENDEIIASVQGYDQWWCASIVVGATGGLGGSGGKTGSFISDDAGKRRVEAWLHPQYSFPVQPNGWVYRTSP